MNLDDYSYEFEGRRYLDPQVSLDEQNAFIDNLRNIQAQNNTEIAQQTYALGTQVPSNLGGLSGGSGYFKARYQTPQTNKAIADLRATAQMQALNTILNNQIKQEEKRYKDAYRAASERASNKGGTSSSGLFSKVANGLNVKTNGEGDQMTEKIKPEDSDTVKKIDTYNGSDLAVAESAARVLDPVGTVIGGGAQDSSSNSVNGFYYVTSDGNRVDFRINNTGRGSSAQSIDTANFSSEDPYGFLSEVVRSGGRIYSPNGTDVSGIYRIFF